MPPPILRARFRLPRDLKAACRCEPPHTILVYTTEWLELGDEVIVDLGGPALKCRVLLRGIVLARQRANPRLRIRAALTVEIAPANAEKFRATVASATGKDLLPDTGPLRIPVAAPVQFQPEGSSEKSPAQLAEVWKDGALLRSECGLPKEGLLTLDFSQHGHAAAGQILSRVARSRSTEIEIQFVYRDPAGLRRIHELIRRACGLGALERLL